MAHFWVHTGWLSVGAILLPAIATTISAIRSHSEMEAVVNKSSAMHEHLSRFCDRFRRLKTRRGRLDSLSLQEELYECSMAMNEEVVDWITVFWDRPVELP